MRFSRISISLRGEPEEIETYFLEMEYDDDL